MKHLIVTTEESETPKDSTNMPAPREHHNLYQHPDYSTDLSQAQKPLQTPGQDNQGDPADPEGNL